MRSFGLSHEDVQDVMGVWIISIKGTTQVYVEKCPLI